MFIEYAAALLKNGNDHIEGLHWLAFDETYRKVAIIAVPKLLEAFPIRARSVQIRHAVLLLKTALRDVQRNLPVLIEIKLAAKSMDVAQKTLWRLTAALLDSPRYENALWQYVEKGDSQLRCRHIVDFLREDSRAQRLRFTLTAFSLAKLIEITAPFAILGWPAQSGELTEFMQTGNLIYWINVLGALGTEEAKTEINRLLSMPSLQKLTPNLQGARHRLEASLREKEFRFQTPQEIAQILANKTPSTAADLTALVLDKLDDIAISINGDNDNGFRAFWNIDGKGKVIDQPRPENECRNILLLGFLNPRLQTYGVTCDPEAQYFNDKRADIKTSISAAIAVPIEIKRSDYKGNKNISLASKLKTQLIGQYTIDPKADGHGIYLILWFGLTYPGGEVCCCNVGDGGKKPLSAKELESRLEDTLELQDRGRIFVRVLDVSWKS